MIRSQLGHRHPVASIGATTLAVSEQIAQPLPRVGRCFALSNLVAIDQHVLHGGVDRGAHQAVEVRRHTVVILLGGQGVNLPRERVFDFLFVDAFQQAVDQIARGALHAAPSLLQAALTLDPQFAMAHRQLARVLSTVGQRDRSLDHLERAFALRESVTPRERYFIEAAYHGAHERYDDAVESLSLLAALYPDDLDAQFELANARSSVGEIERAIEGRLAPHRWKERVGTLGRKDFLQHLPGDRLDIGRVGELRIRHDGGRIGIDEDDPVALFLQRLARLGARVIELTGLADDDRPRADDQYRFDVRAPGHGYTASLATGVPRSSRLCSSISFANRSKR